MGQLADGREFEPYYPRPVTTNYDTASKFGPPSPVVEFPVSWNRRFPAVEYVRAWPSDSGRAP